LELKSRRNGDAAASYIEVKAPSDLAGTKLLALESADGKEEQMLKLASFPGVKRISGSGKRSAFLGSDFTYEDLAIREVARGEHTLFADEAEYWVIETIPSDSPQYAKVRAHITKSDLVARKVEFFDKRDGSLVKVLEVTETAQNGEITLPRRTIMRNVKKGRRTELAVTRQRVDVGVDELPADVFTAEYLER
ncbi:MAG: outer membrane lipoprotein-sorting protein, partial [Myxococcota bacterium]